MGGTSPAPDPDPDPEPEPSPARSALVRPWQQQPPEPEPDPRAHIPLAVSRSGCRRRSSSSNEPWLALLPSAPALRTPMPAPAPTNTISDNKPPAIAPKTIQISRSRLRSRSTAPIRPHGVLLRLSWDYLTSLSDAQCTIRACRPYHRSTLHLPHARICHARATLQFELLRQMLYRQTHRSWDSSRQPRVSNLHARLGRVARAA